MMSSSLPLPLPLPLHSFPDDLKAAINQLLAAYPPAESVIQALVAHYESHEPLLKRQRLQSSAETTTTSKTPTVNALDIMASTLEKNAGKFLFSVKPLPFVTPRKRLELRLFKKHLGLFNPTTTTVEGGAALADIHTIICVPTPNKLKPHFTIALLLSTNAVTTTATTSTSAAAAATFPSSDAFVFGFEAVGNSIVVCDENNRKLTVPGSGFRDTHDAIKFVLKKSTGREIVEPNSTTFKSSKSSKAQSVFHLDCHLGTKEG